jgi:hypothetical protein
MPEEKYPELRSGLPPSEKELQERRYGTFQHKKSPGFRYEKLDINVWKNFCWNTFILAKEIIFPFAVICIQFSAIFWRS